MTFAVTKQVRLERIVRPPQQATTRRVRRLTPGSTTINVPARQRTCHAQFFTMPNSWFRGARSAGVRQPHINWPTAWTWPRRRKQEPAEAPDQEQRRTRQAFCSAPSGLTPELSRPTAGWQQRASVAQSTLLTPRCGVGLNDLLGGPDAGEGKAVATLPKTEARKPGCAPVNPQWVVSEAVDQTRQN